MTPTETPFISQIQELLAQKGYDIAQAGEGVIRVRDVQSGIAFQAALEGNVLYMTVTLMTVPTASLTQPILTKMLSGQNGISTSAFRLYDAGNGKTAVTLNNFCKLQDMGPEDQDDILSLSGYLLADVIEARDLLQPVAA